MIYDKMLIDFPGNGIGITWSRVTDNDLDIPTWNLVQSLLKVPYIYDIHIPIQLSAFRHHRGFVSTCFEFHSNYSKNIIFSIIDRGNKISS